MRINIILLKAVISCASVFLIAAGLTGCAHARDEGSILRPNIIFILVDDLRFDGMGFMNPILDTPNIDRLAVEGAYFPNAYVTTSLCSPSRASILTGRYMKDHGVVDNNAPLSPGSILFPKYLQDAGYKTAMIGKWHMGGEIDDPQPGFDKWISFKGQGEYFPGDNPARESQFNIDGERVPQKGYITDELTDYAIDWIDGMSDGEKPFFLYLSHKAVHADFKPAPRHVDLYRDVEIPLPASMTDSPVAYDGKPRWVRDQRNTWHGVDFPYHSTVDLKEYLRRYYATIAGVDDSVGRILSYLEDQGLAEDTVVLFMGDNGFLFGEFGLIDKRHAYEPSMRVPLLAYGPGRVPQGLVVEDVVANIDIAPTILDLANHNDRPTQFVGQSLVPTFGDSEQIRALRDEILYEYYWEYNYPHTPTTFAIRTDQYKLIQYHGVYDIDELYDLTVDPEEKNNLIFDREMIGVVADLRQRLHDLLATSDGAHRVPYTQKKSSGAVFRSIEGAPAAEFPDEWLRDDTALDLDQHFLPDQEGKYEMLKDGIRD